MSNITQNNGIYFAQINTEREREKEYMHIFENSVH